MGLSKITSVEKKGLEDHESEERLLSTVLGAVLPIECLQLQDPTDAGDPGVQNVPRRTALHQNAPNPFNPMTTIRFDLARKGPLRLHVYDVAGRLVRTLIDDTMEPGMHQTVWNGQDDAGRQVSSGVYLYQLLAGEFRGTRKLVLLR